MGVGEDVGEICGGFGGGGRTEGNVMGLWLEGDGKELVFVVVTELIDPSRPVVEALGRGRL